MTTITNAMLAHYNQLAARAEAETLQDCIARAEAAEAEVTIQREARCHYEAKWRATLASLEVITAKSNEFADRADAAEVENGELKVQIRGLQLTATLTPPRESALIILLARQKLRSEQLEGLLDKAAGLYSDDWPDQFQREVEAALADTEAQDA